MIGCRLRCPKPNGLGHLFVAAGQRHCDDVIGRLLRQKRSQIAVSPNCRIIHFRDHVPLFKPRSFCGSLGDDVVKANTLIAFKGRRTYAQESAALLFSRRKSRNAQNTDATVRVSIGRKQQRSQFWRNHFLRQLDSDFVNFLRLQQNQIVFRSPMSNFQGELFVANFKLRIVTNVRVFGNDPFCVANSYSGDRSRIIVKFTGDFHTCIIQLRFQI